MPDTETGALHRAAAAFERIATLLLRGRVDPETPWPGVRLFLVWVLLRLIVVATLTFAPFVMNDVNYYGTVISGQASPGFPGTLREYPVPALWVLKVPAVLAHDDVGAYGWWFVLIMLVVDGLFLLALQRIARAPRAVTAWLVAGLAIGPLLVLRFDLITGAAVAVALLVVLSRPRLAAALVVVAAGIKLWPGVLVGLVGAAAVRRRPYVAAAAVASVVLVLAAAATHGWSRLLTPLAYQTDRGLQVESLAAFPSMVLWALHVDGFAVDYPASLAFEISGPGTAFAGAISTLASVAALAWTLWATAALWRRRATPDLVTVAGWALLSCISLLVLSNKVFSPQYLTWMLPLVVVVLAVTREQAARTCTYLALAAAIAAQVLYPWLYTSLIEQEPGVGNLLAVAFVGVRLALVCAVAAIATRRAWQLIRVDQPAEDRVPG